MEYVAVTIVFALCMFGLGIGVVLSQQGLRGTCGSDPIANRKGRPCLAVRVPRKRQKCVPQTIPSLHWRKWGIRPRIYTTEKRAFKPVFLCHRKHAGSSRYSVK